jgi:hypothetical protein
MLSWPFSSYLCPYLIWILVIRRSVVADRPPVLIYLSIRGWRLGFIVFSLHVVVLSQRYLESVVANSPLPSCSFILHFFFVKYKIIFNILFLLCRHSNSKPFSWLGPSPMILHGNETSNYGTRSIYFGCGPLS